MSPTFSLTPTFLNPVDLCRRRLDSFSGNIPVLKILNIGNEKQKNRKKEKQKSDEDP